MHFHYAINNILQVEMMAHITTFWVKLNGVHHTTTFQHYYHYFLHIFNSFSYAQHHLHWATSIYLFVARFKK